MVMDLTSILANIEPYSELVFKRFFELIFAPYNYPEMLWIAIPLLATIFLMEFYFGKYKEEEKGWDTPYGNAVVLIFVILDLIRYTHKVGELFEPNLKNLVIFLLIIDTTILILIDFYHLLPKDFVWGLSSELPIKFLAYCAMVFVYTGVPADMITLGGLFLFLLTLYIIMKIIDLAVEK